MQGSESGWWFRAIEQIENLRHQARQDRNDSQAALQMFKAKDNMAVVKYARDQHRADFTPQPAAFVASTSMLGTGILSAAAQETA